MRRTKQEWGSVKEMMIEKFRTLDEKIRQEIWLAFYGKSRLNRLIRNTVYYLLSSNNMLNYFDEVYENVLFRVFTNYVVRLIEGKYEPVFLEKTSIYNARHYCIEEIMKLKKLYYIEDEDLIVCLSDEYSKERMWKMCWEEVLKRVKTEGAKEFVNKMLKRECKIVVSLEVLREVSKIFKMDLKTFKNLLNNICEVEVKCQ